MLLEKNSFIILKDENLSEQKGKKWDHVRILTDIILRLWLCQLMCVNTTFLRDYKNERQTPRSIIHETENSHKKMPPGEDRIGP